MIPPPRGGACAGMSPSLFIITDGSPGEISRAKAACDRCTVRAECLQWAMEGEAFDVVMRGLCAIYGGVMFTPVRGTKAAEIAVELGMPTRVGKRR